MQSHDQNSTSSLNKKNTFSQELTFALAPVEPWLNLAGMLGLGEGMLMENGAPEGFSIPSLSVGKDSRAELLPTMYRISSKEKIVSIIIAFHYMQMMFFNQIGERGSRHFFENIASE